ncbi:MAG: hypothetical protein A2289_22175 [Deltaproteobacteria bacterium RIFOXYA12_FULL_58_15]|nr:MAG: hypothetical protein A2289_22175 [Deltaproteobacteria bacterium RIFOXYA12_FULL_58_15]
MVQQNFSHVPVGGSQMEITVGRRSPATNASVGEGKVAKPQNTADWWLGSGVGGSGEVVDAGEGKVFVSLGDWDPPCLFEGRQVTLRSKMPGFAAYPGDVKGKVQWKGKADGEKSLGFIVVLEPPPKLNSTPPLLDLLVA